MTDEPPRTPNDAQKLCRFCLKQPDQPELALNWRHSEPEIPAIFQQLTGIQLDAAHSIDDDNYYSNLLCISCHNQMKLVVEIRQEFERVANCWQLMIERWRQDRHDDNISTAAAAIDYDQLDTTSDEEDGGRSLSSRRKTTPKSMPPANHLPIYECDICGHGGMQTKRLLQSHMTTHRRVHAKADRGTCHICGKTNLKWLSSHLQDHRKKDRFRCEFCQKGFSRRAQWVNHRRVHTGERPFVCEICAYTFTSASTLANHRKLHRIEEEAAATATPKPKRRHSLAPDVKHKFQKLMRTNRQPKHPAAETKPKLKCPLCSDNDDADNESVALYNNRQTMYQHLKLQHPRPAGIDAWKQMLATMCMECHRPFPDAAALAAHKIEHLDYECSICRRRFNNRLAMEFHVQRHSAKERAHKCEVSSKQKYL